jgi:hypothetical protein
MRSRLGLAVVSLLVALAVFPATAFAWANGPDGADGFGTHDWILYQALVLARPSWIVTDTALQATDDPDSKFGDADKPNHSFYPKGTARGGPDTVTALHRQVLAAYRSNDTTAASYYLGLLSHYYSDLCVPFHTMSGYSDSAAHLQYELLVNSLTTTPGAMPEWVMPWSRSGVEDVRAMAVDAALASRATYPTVATQYVLGGFNETAEMVTRLMLSRAVNDLADIVLSVPEGRGSPEPVRLTATVSHLYPSILSPVSVTATCLDEDDVPVEGVRVRFGWTYASSSGSIDGFSGPDGTVKSYADASQFVMGQRVNVTASLPASQGTMLARTTKSLWFMPTDTIGYTRTSISSSYPAPQRVVTATALVLNATGAPIAGLPVTFRWAFKSSVFSRTAWTGRDGTASNSRNIGNALKGHRVRVTASVPGGGVTRTSSASFVPQNDIASFESSVSTFSPAQNSLVSATFKCLDAQGKALSSVPVEVTWRFRGNTRTSTAYTSSAGIARVTRNVGKATRSYAVSVTGSTPSGSSSKTSSIWFTPR